MITELCAETRNYFVTDKFFGTFEVRGGSISPLDFLQNGQYFRIIGSVFNDGVHQFPAADLVDEVFDGAVWAMGVPPSFVALAAEIEAWQDKATASASPFSSESYPNGYSYSVATGSDGNPLSWQSAFSKRINQWRKI